MDAACSVGGDDTLIGAMQEVLIDSGAHSYVLNSKSWRWNSTPQAVPVLQARVGTFYTYYFRLLIGFLFDIRFCCFEGLLRNVVSKGTTPEAKHQWIIYMLDTLM